MPRGTKRKASSGDLRYGLRAYKARRTAGYVPPTGKVHFTPTMRRQNLATMGFLGTEKKFYDTKLTAQALVAPTAADGGEFDPSATSMISTPTQGTSEQQRDGKRIKIMSVQLNGVLNDAAAELQANPPEGNKVFVALVLNTQTNGAQLNSEDVFKNLNGSAVTAANPTRNLLFGPKFRILKSKVFDLTPNSFSHFAVDSFSRSGVKREFKWFVKFPKGLIVNFNAGTTADVANVMDNCINVICFATVASGTLSYNARIRFIG